MLLVRIDSKKPDAATLKKAIAVLKRGGLVVYPTETAYALGCDPKNAKAMKKIFLVKKRAAVKPLPLIAASPAMARRAAVLDRYASMLADAFWPGPLTLVAPRVTGTKGTGEIAVRVSSAPWAQALSAGLGRPVVSTSANLSGAKTRYDVPSVLRDLGTLPDMLLDAGTLKSAPPSTIVRAHGGLVAILRAGPISEDDLHRALMKRL
ncbi:MAG: L-threonylcarbamoyladenylate synthase [Patescibacteria group bacterium]|nr:MAG: L-threonylcarbamoyladenylate synthase [Patescibacteria group bacterium]